jgi:hypothetical protein
MMTELYSAIEKLDQSFSIYPARSTMEGCPCYVSGAEKRKNSLKAIRAA